MLSLFCLKLATGLAASLLLLSPAQINPRFYRTQFLTILGLTAAAALPSFGAVTQGIGAALGLTLLAAFFASVSWSLDKAPGGRRLVFATALLSLASLILYSMDRASPSGSTQDTTALVTGDLASAWLLGTATSAMLMGHSYLIAPTMSLTPLMRLLAGLASAVVLRALIASLGLWFWTRGHSLINLEDVTVYWLPVRWAMSFLGPSICGWMAWQSARIRSTQSATGILYVVVIFCFLGELTGQLLQTQTGFSL